jgi:hypothetical protein
MKTNQRLAENEYENKKAAKNLDQDDDVGKDKRC